MKTKKRVVEPTSSVAAVDTGTYLLGLNLFPALLGILCFPHSSPIYSGVGLRRPGESEEAPVPWRAYRQAGWPWSLGVRRVRSASQEPHRSSRSPGRGGGRAVWKNSQAAAPELRV